MGIQTLKKTIQKKPQKANNPHRINRNTSLDSIFVQLYV